MRNYEKQRIESNKVKVLSILREAGSDGVLNTDLSKIALRYGAIISNLHMAGYHIDNQVVNGGVRRYFLISEPKEEIKPKKGIELLMEAINDNHGSIVYDYELEQLLEQLNLTVVRKSGTHSKRRGA